MSKSSKQKRVPGTPADASSPRTQLKSEPPASETRTSGLSRGEIALVLMILACGVVIRIGMPDRLAVEHFDEGVYASNLWFGPESGGQYPARHLYAPPLAPALIESSLLAEQVIGGSGTRPSGWAAMFPSLLAGCLTPLIVWWVTRTWFGPSAAIGATTLAACSEFHALYTRTALTDVLLLPWMLLAVYLFERALSARQLRLLTLAGLACGLAWWTKYNGWLPLLIGLGGILLRLICVNGARRSIVRDLTWWAGFAVIAAAAWSPVLWSLQRTGGYAEVMANHRGYVVGLSGWPASLTNQLANLAQFDGWVSCLGPAVALLLVWQYRMRRHSFATESDDQETGRDLWSGPTLAVALAALAAWCGLAVVVAFLSCVGLLADGLRQREKSHDEAAIGSLGIWLVVAWFAGLFVLTPLYSPYPRLTLTWLCASWLAGGVGVAVLQKGCVRGSEASRLSSIRRLRSRRFVLLVLLVASLTVLYFSGQRVADRGMPAWQDRAGMRDAASSIAATIDIDNSVVFVQGEPGLFYQLRADRVVAVPSFDFNLSPASLPVGVAGYLVTGLHAQRSDDFQRQLTQAKHRLEEVGSIPFQPSELVLLNNYRPHQLDQQRHAAWRVKLYRLK